MCLGCPLFLLIPLFFPPFSVFISSLRPSLCFQDLFVVQNQVRSRSQKLFSLSLSTSISVSLLHPSRTHLQSLHTATLSLTSWHPPPSSFISSIHPCIFSSPLWNQFYSHPEREKHLWEVCMWGCEMEKVRKTTRKRWRGVIKTRWAKKYRFGFDRTWGRHKNRKTAVKLLRKKMLTQF